MLLTKRDAVLENFLCEALRFLRFYAGERKRLNSELFARERSKEHKLAVAEALATRFDWSSRNPFIIALSRSTSPRMQA